MHTSKTRFDCITFQTKAVVVNMCMTSCCLCRRPALLSSSLHCVHSVLPQKRMTAGTGWWWHGSQVKSHTNSDLNDVIPVTWLYTGYLPTRGDTWKWLNSDLFISENFLFVVAGDDTIVAWEKNWTLKKEQFVHYCSLADKLTQALRVRMSAHMCVCVCQ